MPGPVCPPRPTERKQFSLLLLTVVLVSALC
jgi:hypothetical protein